MVDLANEADTTRWYARRLRRTASGLISRLAPLTLFVHRADQKSLEDSEWNAIAKHGTLALAAWCERWGIAGAKFLGQSPLLDDDDDDGDDDKAATPEDHPVVNDDLTRTLDRRLELMGLMARRMLNEELPDGARRLLLLLLGHLRYSPHMDIVLVSKRFLPGDIGVSPAEAADACRALYVREFIERVEALSEATGDALALRLLVEVSTIASMRPPTARRPSAFQALGSAESGPWATSSSCLCPPSSSRRCGAGRLWPKTTFNPCGSGCKRRWAPSGPSSKADGYARTMPTGSLK